MTAQPSDRRTTIVDSDVIGVLTHHWALPDKVDAARKLLDGNGAAQRAFPGFVSRKTLLSRTDATQITTLVLWESNEVYDAWRASPERDKSMAGAEALWAKPPQSERFQVVEEG